MPHAATTTVPRPRRRGRLDVRASARTAETLPAGRELPSVSTEPRAVTGRTVRTSMPDRPGHGSRRTPKAAATASRRAPKQPGGRLSALDAAALVLGSVTGKEASDGLSAQELIRRMERAKLWTSPSGKTPAATLYAAMLREAAARRGASRFRKMGPGRFASASRNIGSGTADRSANQAGRVEPRKGAVRGAGGS